MTFEEEIMADARRLNDIYDKILENQKFEESADKTERENESKGLYSI